MSTNCPPQPNCSRTHRLGVIVILFALLIPILIVILGFTIDYANMQRVRNEARVIADLSAKAAADTLARTGGDIAIARQAAKDVAAANAIQGVGHTLDDEDIIFGRAQLQSDGQWNFNAGITPFNSVRVNAIRDTDSPAGRVNLFFGQFYGQPSFDLQQQATASFRDVEICLVLDRSGSMKWNTTGTLTTVEMEARQCIPPVPTSRWRALDTAIELFLSELDATPVHEQIGMVTFASDGVVACSGLTSIASRLDQPLTTNTGLVRAAMDTLNTSVWFGGTNITAGIERARLHMQSNGNPNRDQFIVVFTDGVHNTSDPPFDEALACAAAGITVHTITFSDEANLTDMELTATNGGGEHYHADNTSELNSIFRRLAGTFAIITK